MRCSEPLSTLRHPLPPLPFRPPCRRAALRSRYAFTLVEYNATMSLLTPSDFNFFALAEQLHLGISERFEDVPASPGAYMLFSGNGHFVYSGKASDLRQRINDHFSPREENPLIRILARYFIWRVTATEAAGEVLEGELYDLWLEATGVPPLANRNAPPGSKAEYPKLAQSKLLILANYLKTK